VQFSLSVPVVLHEHEIPDLDIPVKIIIFASRRPTRNIRAMIVKNF
jgi:hypothetical protein